MDERTEAQIERVHQLLNAGDEVEAATALRALMSPPCEDAETCLQAAIAAMEVDPELTREWAIRAADLAPDDPGTTFRAAHVLFTVSQYAPDALDDSLELLQRTVATMDPDFPLLENVLHLIGRIGLVRGNDPEATEAALKAAFEIEPEYLEHGQFYAECLVDAGRLADAAPVVHEALEHHPTDRYLVAMRDFLDAERSGHSRRLRPPPPDAFLRPRG